MKIGSFEQRVGECADILQKWYTGYHNSADIISTILELQGIDIKQPKEALVQAITKRCKDVEDKRNDGVKLLLENIAKTQESDIEICSYPLKSYESLKIRSAMSILYLHCTRHGNDEVQECLTKYADYIDLSYHEGSIFISAISCPKKLNTLVEFYKETKMADPPGSMQYQAARKKLCDMLQDAYESCTYRRATEKAAIHDIIRPYVVMEDDESEAEESLSDCVGIPGDDMADEQDAPDLMDSEFLDGVVSKPSTECYQLKTDGSSTILPLKCENLVVLRFPYWQFNIAAEEYYEQGKMVECKDAIHEAAKLVSRNSMIDPNRLHKATVVYNYLRFTESNFDEMYAKLGSKNRLEKYVPDVMELAAAHHDTKLLLALSELGAELADVPCAHDDLKELSDHIASLNIDAPQYHGSSDTVHVEADMHALGVQITEI